MHVDVDVVMTMAISITMHKACMHMRSTLISHRGYPVSKPTVWISHGVARQGR